MSRRNAGSTFLGRSGKIFGPFTATELLELRAKGELSAYTWIWEDGSGWKALDPPPPEPVFDEAAAEETVQTAPSPRPEPATAARPEPRPDLRPQPERAPAPSAPRAPRITEITPRPGLAVVCHDFHHLVTGGLQRITDSGCELVSVVDSGPQFNRRSPLMLNILDPATGETMNASARLASVSRVDGKWTYRLQWDACPDIVAASV
ncbi:MAG: hypothetical protein NDJ90_13515 [Oligoflexia bacterium]|nr:hypothetical protein [Oligoflexia bacterium]